VRDLTRKAGIKPTTTRVNASHPLLREVAPGERDFPGGVAFAEPSSAGQQGRGAARGGRPAPRGQKAPGAQAGTKGPRGQGGQAGTRGQRGAADPRVGAGAGRRSGGGGRGGSPKSGSAAVYSTSTGGSSGGAAGFSSRSRAGSGRAR